MMGGKAVRVGMTGEVRKPDRTALADHQPENAVSRGKVSDPGAILVRDAVRHELLQHPSIRSKDADRGVPRADHLGGNLRDPIEHAVERCLGREGQPGQHQLFESIVLR